MCIYIYIHTHMFTYVHIYIYICMHICMTELCHTQGNIKRQQQITQAPYNNHRWSTFAGLIFFSDLALFWQNTGLFASKIGFLGYLLVVHVCKSLSRPAKQRVLHPIKTALNRIKRALHLMKRALQMCSADEWETCLSWTDIRLFWWDLGLFWWDAGFLCYLQTCSAEWMICTSIYKWTGFICKTCPYTSGQVLYAKPVHTRVCGQVLHIKPIYIVCTYRCIT